MSMSFSFLSDNVHADAAWQPLQAEFCTIRTRMWLGYMCVIMPSCSIRFAIFVMLSLQFEAKVIISYEKYAIESFFLSLCVRYEYGLKVAR